VTSNLLLRKEFTVGTGVFISSCPLTIFGVPWALRPHFLGPKFNPIPVSNSQPMLILTLTLTCKLKQPLQVSWMYWEFKHIFWCDNLWLHRSIDYWVGKFSHTPRIPLPVDRNLPTVTVQLIIHWCRWRLTFTLFHIVVTFLTHHCTSYYFSCMSSSRYCGNLVVWSNFVCSFSICYSAACVLW